MRPFQAIIFDMDGVIVDSEPLHERAFREVFEEIGFGHTHGIDFSAYYGKSDLVVWRDFIARHRPPQPLEELLARKEAKFAALLQREEPIFNGLPELLEKVSAQYPLALASGSRHPTINGPGHFPARRRIARGRACGVLRDRRFRRRRGGRPVRGDDRHRDYQFATAGETVARHARRSQQRRD